MKPRFPISARIFFLAFANLMLLALVLLAFARFQLHLQFHSFLFGPAEDRVISVARLIALDLEITPLDARDDLLARYGRTYGVSMYLFGDPREARQIGGQPIELPPAVMNELRKPPPRRNPPPPRGEAGDNEPPPPPRESPGGRGPEQSPSVFAVSAGDPALYWVGARIPIREPGDEVPRPGLLLMSAPSFLGTRLFFDYKPWLGLAFALIVVSVLCWLPLIRGLTRAVSQMSQVTAKIAEGQFDHQLSEERGDELGLLAAGINRMAQRLSGFVTGQKRFLGDIAHELCAPVARIQFALGVLEHKTEPGTVDDLQDEVRQMSSLVGELLSFSKAGMEQADKPLVPVDVADAVRQAIAQEGDPNVDTAIDKDLAAIADPDYLRRSIANLVRNAIRYAGDYGPVTVSARRDRNQVAIVVADSGPGLPTDEIDRVFTPFYRVETSRNRNSGGVGLGLAIVKSCIEACKGTVRCRNRIPTGLEVEIRLPAAP